MDKPYANVVDLRAEGVDAAAVPATAHRSLILLASRIIDRLTGQWFFPRRETLRLDGDGSAILQHPALVPVLEVRRLEVDGRVYVATDHAVRDRYVELVDGVFGWLERRPRAETALATELVEGDTEATLADATGLRTKDALLVDEQVPLIAGSISGTQEACDAVPTGASLGAEVVSYGRVPRPIERTAGTW